MILPRTPKAPGAGHHGRGHRAGIVQGAAHPHRGTCWDRGDADVARRVAFEGVGRALSLEVVLLVVASLALGQCLVGSGAADWLASGAVSGVRT